jgi:uncharacterized protein DUF4383
MPMVTPKQFAIAFGLVYLIVTVLGFFVTGFSQATTQLIVFDLNLVHNIVHLLIGAFGVAAFFAGPAIARLYAQVLGIVLAVVAFAGLLPQPLLGVVPVGGADIVLHAATAIIALYVGFKGASAEAEADAEADD